MSRSSQAKRQSDTATVLEFSQLERMFMNTTKTMADLIEHTLSILKEEKVLIAGAFALYKHAEPRATRDFDLVVSPAHIEKIETLLTQNGFRLVEQYEYQKPTRFLHKYEWNQKNLDLIFFEHQKFSDFLFSTSEPMELSVSATTKVVSAEGLVLMKLIAARGGKKPGTEHIGRDFADIQSIAEKKMLDWKTVKLWSADLGIMYKFGDLVEYLGIKA